MPGPLLELLGGTGYPETKLTTLEKAGSQSRVKVLSLTVTDLEGGGMIELPQVYSRSDLHLSSDNLITRGEVERWPHLRDLPLRHAAIEDITLLIGQDCPEALIPLTTVPGARGEPYAIRTCLGWTVNGPVLRQRKLPPSSHFIHSESLDRLHEGVDKSQHLESEGTCKQEKGAST